MQCPNNEYKIKIWDELKGFWKDPFIAFENETVGEVKNKIINELFKTNEEDDASNYYLCAILYNINGKEELLFQEDGDFLSVIIEKFKTSNLIDQQKKKDLYGYNFHSSKLDTPTLILISVSHYLFYQSVLKPKKSFLYLFTKPNINLINEDYSIDEEKLKIFLGQEEQEPFELYPIGFNLLISNLLKEEIIQERIYYQNNSYNYDNSFNIYITVEKPLEFCRMIFIIFCFYKKISNISSFLSNLFSHDFFDYDNEYTKGFFKILQDHPPVLENAICSMMTFFGQGTKIFENSNESQRPINFVEKLYKTLNEATWPPSQINLKPQNFENLGEEVKNYLYKIFPSLLPFEKKIELLTKQYYSEYIITVNRQNILKSVFDLKIDFGPQIINSFRVSFESSIDAGGPSNEFVTLAFQELVKESEDLFSLTLENNYWFKYHENKDKILENKFISIGILLGMVLKKKIPIPIHFPKCFYKLLKGENSIPDDIFEIYPIKKNEFKEFSILKVFAPYLSNDYNLFTKKFDFTNKINTIGNYYNNQGTPTKLEEKDLFYMAQNFLFHESIAFELEALKKGFFATQPDWEILKWFSAEEFSLYLSGPIKFDFEGLISTMEFQGIENSFKEVFQNLSNENKKFFYTAITGLFNSPIGGFSIQDKKHITIQKFYGNEDYFIHTCFWRVDIKFTDENDLKNLLISICDEGKNIIKQNYNRS